MCYLIRFSGENCALSRLTAGASHPFPTCKVADIKVTLSSRGQEGRLAPARCHACSLVEKGMSSIARRGRPVCLPRDGAPVARITDYGEVIVLKIAG